ncbi:NEW3 domain-containing protein [[Eubacterium] cellulosolvens]
MVLKNLKLFNILLLLIILLLTFTIIIYAPGRASANNETEKSEVSLKPVSETENVYYDPGSTVLYNLELKNEGEIPETFIIEIDSTSGWNISLVNPREASVTLSPEKTAEITVEIEIPTRVAEGDYEFSLLISSKTLVPPFEKVIHSVVTPDGVIITTTLRPVLIITPSLSQLGIISPGKTLKVDIKVKCYVVPADVYLKNELYRFIDSARVPEKELQISVEPERVRIEKGEYEIFELTINFPKKYNERANYTCYVSLQAYAVGYDEISKSVTLNFLVWHVPDNTANVNILTHPVTIVGVSMILILGALGAVISGNEAGKYLLLSVIFIPLYTKLHKDKILDHFTRGRVYEYIRSNPGVHYSEIKRELELNNGNLTYHLHTMEREALIKSRTKGRFKVFYPMDVKIPADMEPQISAFRSQLLDIIREHPGITQKELGAMLPTKKQRTISYHIKTMSREGVLELEKVGRETHCYLTDKVIDIKPGSEQKAQADGDSYSSKFLENDSFVREI